MRNSDRGERCIVTPKRYYGEEAERLTPAESRRFDALLTRMSRPGFDLDSLVVAPPTFPLVCHPEPENAS